MTKIFKYTFSLLFLLSLNVFSQDLMEYSVNKGETLKDIANKFDVSYIKLLRHNRGVSRRPDEGAVIEVPISPFVTQKPPKDIKPENFDFSKAEEVLKSKEPNTIHIVKPQETLYGLSKQYGVTIGDLVKENPVLANEGLKIGQKLKLPTNTVVALNTLKTKVFQNIEHIVKPQETLYSLSKQYNLPIDSLKNYNKATLWNGLSVGDTLKIPNKTLASIEKEEEKVLERKHVVQPQETLYSLSKQYNFPIDSLKSYNKEMLWNGLSVGDTLKIPNQIIKTVPLIKNKQHRVAQGETLYGIARKYGISVPELLSVNNAVVTNDMAIGTVLNLPSKVTILEKDITPKTIYKHQPVKYNYDGLEVFDSVLSRFSITEDSIRMLNANLDSLKIFGGELLLGFKRQNVLFEEQTTFKDSIVTDKVVNLMLMLPFDLKNTKDLSEMSLFSNPKGLPSMVADFYLGAKMAVDSLLEQRVKVNFTVVDTEKSVDSIHKKIDTIRAFEPHLILGPLYTSNTRYIASSFPNVPVYYPIYSKNQKKLTAPNIVKTATDKEIFKQELISYIKRNRKGEHLILVGSKENKEYLDALQAVMVKKDSLQNSLKRDVTVLALEKEYVSKDDFMEHIEQDKENWILVTESSNVITADVFNNSISIANDSIVTPVKILSFEKSKYVDDNVSYQHLSKFNYTYATDQVEYQDVLNSGFSHHYLSTNKAYPNYYVQRGFSVTYDAVLRFLKGNALDVHQATQRLNQAFYYEKPNNPEQLKNENQSVFINTICKENGEIMVKRLQ